MKYTCIYSDAAGESHFEEISVDVVPVDFAPPAALLNWAAPIASERMRRCSVPVGWVGDGHPTPRRPFYFQRSGELEVQVSEGEIRNFSAGSLVLLSDTSGKGHLTRALGHSEVDAVFIQRPEGAA